MHDKVVPGLLQIGRHALAHHAEADESYPHVQFRRAQNAFGSTRAQNARAEASLPAYPAIASPLIAFVLFSPRHGATLRDSDAPKNGKTRTISLHRPGFPPVARNGNFRLNPKFQRRGVWTPAARSFFIDTLLRQMPVPPITFVSRNPKTVGARYVR
jgi:hypothetical protein